MHSVGGLEVLSRLQVTFSLLGAMIPPMCSLVLSYVNHLAVKGVVNEPESSDLWGLDDIPVVAHNFREALIGTQQYKAWQVDSLTAAGRRWLTIPPAM